MYDLITILKKRRLSLNKTQHEISNNIYISQNTFSDYENKRKEVKLSRLEDIAKELNGSIKFIPNEKITTVYIHQISIVARDTKTKEILNSDYFNEEFESFKTDLYYDYSYMTDIGEGNYEDNIVVNEKTLDNDLFIDDRVLDVSKLATRVNDIIIKDFNNNDVKLDSSEIKCSLIDLNEDGSSKIDLIIAEKTYDFIKEFIDITSYMYFDTQKDYESYLEEEDLFITYRIVPLYDRLSDEDTDDKFKYFIR